ncbi:MAG: acetyl-CoA carboxylase biotin carboxyl carrier protein [Acidobacteriota bacterium]
MTLKEIIELIDKVAGSGISSLEIERAGLRLKIEARPAVVAAPAREATGEAASAAGVEYREEPDRRLTAPQVPKDAGEDEPAWHIITSPIVGTFYRAPNPETEPFIEVGSRIQKGGVLCIIEAMKLMNEIESDVDGVVVKIYPQNGQPIEYGEKLFAVQL